ncbi:response regulator [Tsuneonella rigui]|uniref:response regulator n=1 Tax=Tsuneonella rigui TaxID=1708790 RepID=UPI000F7D7222|nr:response regulator [Tsuneonella rigui]
MPKAAPLQVLIVEDEAILVMDLSMMVEDAGCMVVAEAPSLPSVAALAKDLNPDLAFVDVQLAEGSSGLEVSTLIQQRWPDTFIVFVTANSKSVPADFGGAQGVIPKPFSRNGIISALRYIEQGIRHPPPAEPMPPSFTPAPALAAQWTSSTPVHR